jgi:hypothetical protein
LPDRRLLRAAEQVERHVLQLGAKVFGDQLAAGQYGDVLQHGLAALADTPGTRRYLDGLRLASLPE